MDVRQPHDPVAILRAAAQRREELAAQHQRKAAKLREEAAEIRRLAQEIGRATSKLRRQESPAAAQVLRRQKRIGEAVPGRDREDAIAGVGGSNL